MAEQDKLLALALSISDGQAVDWDAVEDRASDAAERELIHFLRDVLRIAQAGDGPAAEALGSGPGATARLGHRIAADTNPEAAEVVTPRPPTPAPSKSSAGTTATTARRWPVPASAA